MWHLQNAQEFWAKEILGVIAQSEGRALNRAAQNGAGSERKKKIQKRQSAEGEKGERGRGLKAKEEIVAREAEE